MGEESNNDKVGIVIFENLCQTLVLRDHNHRSLR